jgi:formamidopyrimidine-DNA glycosylase
VPELPEVEVTRRRLKKLVVGRRIARVATTEPSYFFLTPPKTLARRLVGRTGTGLERHGKYLTLALDDGSALLLHLGMTGQLFASNAPGVRLLRFTDRKVASSRGRDFRPDSHTHLRLAFADRGPSVYFRDARKFGKCQWLAPGATSPRLERLGTDALRIDAQSLYAMCRERRVSVKSLLLDQSAFAGVGNIYADEALFLARIRPARPARGLSKHECVKLSASVRAVLRRAIQRGGSTISDFVHPDGGAGAYQDERRVYARGGEPCFICRRPIARMLIGQRSSHFCPRCQK